MATTRRERLQSHTHPTIQFKEHNHMANKLPFSQVSTIRTMPRRLGAEAWVAGEDYAAAEVETKPVGKRAYRKVTTA